jgi:hypothetical protein
LEDCLGIVWIGEVQPEMSSYIWKLQRQWVSKWNPVEVKKEEDLVERGKAVAKK